MDKKALGSNTDYALDPATESRKETAVAKLMNLAENCFSQLNFHEQGPPLTSLNLAKLGIQTPEEAAALIQRKLNTILSAQDIRASIHGALKSKLNEEIITAFRESRPINEKVMEALVRDWVEDEMITEFLWPFHKHIPASTHEGIQRDGTPIVAEAPTDEKPEGAIYIKDEKEQTESAITDPFICTATFAYAVAICLDSSFSNETMTNIVGIKSLEAAEKVIAAIETHAPCLISKEPSKKD